MLSDQQIAEKATTESIVRLDWKNDKLLTFTTTRPANYSFSAGQYARLGLSDSSGPIWRAFSMTSSPQEGSLEFYAVIVPGGLFTSRLKDVKPGDPILVDRQSFGFMTPDRFEDGEDLWMFATGTGVGPYISMLREPAVWEKFRRLIVVHCVRHSDEFVYHDLLNNLAERPPTAKEVPASLQVIRSTTRDSDAPAAATHLNGRITTLLESGALERHAGLPLSVEASRIMLCGNPQMIEDMRRLLHQRGMRPCRRAQPGQFVTENYW